jgi:pimeloyl-ACP methyl ester carboxylesterase
MYELALIELASRGVSALAFDCPGFGGSMRPEHFMNATAVADCLSSSLANLTDRQVVLVGGHLSAEFALYWALQSPDQVSGVVLDGVYALTEEEFQPLLEPYAGLSPRFNGQGTHETFLWRATCAVMKEWNPHLEPSPDTMEAIYGTMSDYLAMGYPAIRDWMESDKPAPGLAVLELVRAVRQPMLVLTAEDDPLRCAFERTISACTIPPRSHEFSGAHPLVTKGSEPTYAEVLTRFIKSL